MWSQFQKCVAEKDDEEMSLVDEMFLVFRTCVRTFANLSSRRNFAKTLSFIPSLEEQFLS